MTDTPRIRPVQASSHRRPPPPSSPTTTKLVETPPRHITVIQVRSDSLKLYTYEFILEEGEELIPTGRDTPESITAVYDQPAIDGRAKGVFPYQRGIIHAPRNKRNHIFTGICVQADAPDRAKLLSQGSSRLRPYVRAHATYLVKAADRAAEAAACCLSALPAPPPLSSDA